MTIYEIENKINNLDKNKVELIRRIYDISTFTTTIEIPNSFKNRIEKYFDTKIDNIKTQKIVKIINKWSEEGALFNYLRSYRPGIKDSKDIRIKINHEIENAINNSKENCDFCFPEKFTPEDSFGRIEGKYCITAANIAKYDNYHSLLIFKKHNPLDFNFGEFNDYISTSFKWFEKVHKISNNYIHPMLIWNCLAKAGASKTHGHFQLLTTKTIYPKIKSKLNINSIYYNKYKHNYFLDILQIHEYLDLIFKKDKNIIIAYLTPIKENEVIILSPELDENFIYYLYNILRIYIDRLNIKSFNFTLFSLNLDETFKNFKKFYFKVNKFNKIFIAKIVDRGNPLKNISDIASMEIFASSVISSDPYNVIANLKKYL